VETSLAAGIVTVEKVMELLTGRYIDFPGVRIVDLDPPSSRATTGRCWRW
jgi:hypothetical protein